MRALIGAFTVIAVTSCGGGDGGSNGTVTTPTNASVASISLSRDTATLLATATLQLTGTTKDAQGNVLSGRTITWTSSAPAVATVSSAGVVTAVAAGTATITATSEGKTATAAFTVIASTVISAAGGTVVSADGKATLVIPAGAVSQATPIAVLPTTTFPASALLVSGTTYDFEPSGTQFAQPVTVRINYTAANVPAGVAQSAVRLYVAGTTTWTQVAGSTVDTVAHTISGTTTHFSEYAGLAQPFSYLDFDDDNDQVGMVVNQITICVGELAELDIHINDPAIGSFFPFQPTITAGNPAIVTPFLGTDAGYDIGIGGVATGTTSVTTSIGVQQVSIQVTVINTKPPCFSPLLGLTGLSGLDPSSENILTLAALPLLQGNIVGGAVRAAVTTSAPTALTSDGVSRYPALGLDGGASGPLAYRNGAFPYTEKVYWDGTNGAATTITPPANSVPVGSAFLDASTFLFVTNDIYAVTKTSSTPVKLTNLGGAATYIATGSDGTMYFDWRTNLGGGPTHIYSLPFPGTTSPPVTTGQVQLTSGSLIETQPAIAQDNHLLAFAQYDANVTFGQILVKDLAKPTAPLVLASPATGFAFTPAWCGNEFLYYSYSTNINGPYQVMKWNAVTRTSAVLSATASVSVADIALARTNGDHGMHACP